MVAVLRILVVIHVTMEVLVPMKPRPGSNEPATHKPFRLIVAVPARTLRQDAQSWAERPCATGENCWWTGSNPPTPIMDHDPQLTAVTTTLENGLVSRVSYTYDAYNNVTAKGESDWGSGNPGSTLRQTQTTYSYYVPQSNNVTLASNTSGSFTPDTSVSLPAEVKILDGGGTVYSDTKYTYDPMT